MQLFTELQAAIQKTAEQTNYRNIIPESSSQQENI
jgi:hypothetical protein